MGKRKKDPPKVVDAKYEPTERERSVLDKQRLRRAAKLPAPRLKVELKDGNHSDVSVDYADLNVGADLLKEALGTADEDFTLGLIEQLANLSLHNGYVRESDLNFMFSVIKDIKPNDQLEAMLAAQMAAVHLATMTFARRLASVDYLPQQDSAERALNKLMRTFTTQMEALKRYRSGGEQKVTVQHVSVGEGGQAIVGNVTQAAREAVPQKSAEKTRALTNARQPAMPMIENPERVPTAARRRQKDDGQSSS